MVSLTDDQLLHIALAYGKDGSGMSIEEFLVKTAQNYEEIKKAYKKNHHSSARVGSKERSGL